MAIGTYAQLQSTLSWYANRDDLFTAITTFSPAAIDSAVQIAISLAESTINNDIASRGGIKYAETVNNALVTVGGTETLAMPSDFKSIKSLMLTTDPFRILMPKNPNDLFSTYTSSTVVGYPQAYAVVGTSTLYLRPVPDGVYTLRLIYNASLAALSNTNTANWLLTNNPHVYLGAAMVELCVMLENDEQLGKWKGYYDQKMNDMMGDDRMTRWTAVDPSPRPFGAIA